MHPPVVNMTSACLWRHTKTHPTRSLPPLPVSAPDPALQPLHVRVVEAAAQQAVVFGQCQRALVQVSNHQHVQRALIHGLAAVQAHQERRGRLRAGDSSSKTATTHDLSSHLLPVFLAAADSAAFAPLPQHVGRPSCRQAALPAAALVHCGRCQLLGSCCLLVGRTSR